MKESFQQIIFAIINTATISGLIIFGIKKYIDNKFNEKLSKFQVELEELNFYKRHYYEKEFEIYKEISKAILKCSQDNLKLFELTDHFSQNKEVLSKLRLDAINSINNLTNVIIENYPLYPKDIYERALDLRTVCHRAYTDWEEYKINPLYETQKTIKPTLINIDEHIKNIGVATDETLRLIRNNFDNYRKK